MKVKISARNMITIPKDIRDKLNWNSGDNLELKLDGNNIIISKSNDKEEVKIAVKSKNNSKKGLIKIVSNLEEGQNFSKKIYSECGLVIRTKRKYMNKFCEECKGQLAAEYGPENHPCKFYNEIMNSTKEKSNTVKQSRKIIDELINNVNKVQSKLDKRIEIINNSESTSIVELENTKVKTNKHKNKLVTTSDTTIQPIAFLDYKKCGGCGEFYDSGFLLDNVFRCKKCTIDDFSNYLKNNKEERGS